MPRLGIYPGYFRSDRKAGQQSFTAAGLHLGKGGNGPSGIEQPTELAKPKCAGIYDMQGCKVTGKLLPGMYIVDGKKMMVK